MYGINAVSQIIIVAAVLVMLCVVGLFDCVFVSVEPPASSEAKTHRFHQPACKQESQVS